MRFTVQRGSCCLGGPIGRVFAGVRQSEVETSIDVFVHLKRSVVVIVVAVPASGLPAAADCWQGVSPCSTVGSGWCLSLGACRGVLFLSSLSIAVGAVAVGSRNVP